MKALRKLGKGAESVQLCEVEKPIEAHLDKSPFRARTTCW